MLFKKNKKELTEDQKMTNSGFCPYRCECTDFEKICYKCKNNGLNKKSQSHFR